MDTQNTSPTRKPAMILEAINAGLTPYMLGTLDAGCGRDCTPCEYYIWAGDVAEYREGFNVQTADMHAAQRFGLMLGAMVGTEELVRLLDTVDYEQDILDREDHSRGGW